MTLLWCRRDVFKQLHTQIEVGRFVPLSWCLCDVAGPHPHSVGDPQQGDTCEETGFALDTTALKAGGVFGLLRAGGRGREERLLSTGEKETERDPCF